MPDASSQQLGALAAERGLITAEQLEEVLEEHERRRAAGSRLPLGELIVEMGLITRPQLDALLDAQGGKKAPRQVIEGFELIRKLGEGGMGATYLARQVSMDRLVALKVLRKNMARDSDFVERFQREARLAAKLDHVNIVQPINVGQSGGFNFLVMEYVEGKDLHQLMPEQGPMEEGFALHVTIQVARALEQAHKQGIIHRDIKPDNVLVDANGVAKLCDFGLAKQTTADSHLTQTGMAMGTPHYVSPEQARGEADVGIRSDIYSLGATLYHLVTGQTPFSGSTAAVVMTKHLTEQMPWPGDINPGLSKNCCRLIERMMAKDPEDRYQTPAELITDLERVIDGKPPEIQVLSPGQSSVGLAGTVPFKPQADAPRPRRYRTAQLRRPRGRATEDAAGRAKPAVSERLLIGIGSCLLVVAALILWAATRGGDEREPTGPKGQGAKTAPAPGPDEKSIEEMFEFARDYWAKHPDDYGGSRAKFEMVRDSAGGTVWAMRTEDALKEIGAARGKAADAVLAGLLRRAGKLAGPGDFDAALAALAKPPGKFADILASRLKAAARKFRADAERKLDAAIEAAEKLSKDGRPQKGIEKLDGVAGIKYAPRKGRLAALRARLEREKLDVAALERKRREAGVRKRLAGMMVRAYELIMNRKYQEADKLLATEKKRFGKEDLELISAELGAAERVVGELSQFDVRRRKALKDLIGKQVSLKKRDKTVHRVRITKISEDVLDVAREYVAMGDRKTVDYQIKFADLAPGEFAKLLPAFEPRTPDGQVAAALLAMADGNFAAAGRALAAAGGHPLARACAAALEARMRVAVEAAAANAWKQLVKPLVRGKYTVPQAEKLLTALEAFLAGHGGTKFATKLKPEVDRLRRPAEKTIEDSPSGMLAKVRKLFRGEVRKFNPKTLEIELFYDFEKAGQAADWSLSEWFEGNRGGSMKVDDGALRMSGTGRCALLAGRFTAVSVSVDCKLLGAKNVAALMICADPQGSFYHVMGNWQGTSYLERATRGKWKVLTRRQRSPILRAKGGTMSISIDDQGLIRGRVGKKEFEASDKTHRSGQVGFFAENSETSFDNLRIVGKLDRAWLEAELRKTRATIPVKPGVNPWAGAWRQMKPKRKVTIGVYSASTFDTKRNRYIIAANDYSVRAYSLRTNRWSRILRSVKGDGTSFPKDGGNCPPSVIYVKERDGLIYMGGNNSNRPGCGGTAFFSMMSKKWTLLSKRQDIAPALVLGAGNFLRYTGSQLYRFDAGKKAWTEIRAKPKPPARTFPGRAMIYDPPRKRFLLFASGPWGKAPYDDTWVFDPASNRWTELRPAARPPARAKHTLAYDSENDLVVCHGGAKRTDTWVFDAKRNSWFEIRSPAVPPEETGHLEYDPVAKHGIVWNRKNGEVWALRIVPTGR